MVVTALCRLEEGSSTPPSSWHLQLHAPTLSNLVTWKLKCSLHSRVPLFATPRAVATESSVHEILQARILELSSHSLLQRIFPTQD